jgi:hypothetical protein
LLSPLLPPKLARDRYEALHAAIMGDRESWEGRGRDIKREQDGLAAKGWLLRNNAVEIAGELARA